MAKAYRRIIPEPKLVKANEAFVLRFSEELNSTMDLATLNAGPYANALAIFLSNDAVQYEVQASGARRADCQKIFLPSC
ncbi:MAG: hypothetical protein M3Z32_12770 [Acidobacteriota bacterium]|nr:hypothetical protein [Acidobacteriota bacterium]